MLILCILAKKTVFMRFVRLFSTALSEGIHSTASITLTGKSQSTKTSSTIFLNASLHNFKLVSLLKKSTQKYL